MIERAHAAIEKGMCVDAMFVLCDSTARVKARQHADTKTLKCETGILQTRATLRAISSC